MYGCCSGEVLCTAQTVVMWGRFYDDSGAFSKVYGTLWINFWHKLYFHLLWWFFFFMSVVMKYKITT